MTSQEDNKPVRVFRLNCRVNVDNHIKNTVYYTGLDKFKRVGVKVYYRYNTPDYRGCKQYAELLELNHQTGKFEKVNFEDIINQS